MRSALLPLLFTLPVVPQATDDEARFVDGLDRARRMMQAGKWEEARSTFLGLVQEHEGQDYVLVRQLDVFDGVKLCSFRMKFPERSVEDLISGTIVQRKKSGWVKLRYSGDRLRDFESRSKALVHPMTFEGSYSIEIELDSYPENNFPSVLVGFDTESPVQVVFGRKKEGKANVLSWLPASIHEKTAAGWEKLAEKENPALVSGEPCVLKVTVKSGSIAAYGNGKKIISARRKAGIYGQVALYNVSSRNVREILLYGDSQSSWFENVLDEAFQQRWKVFSFDGKDVFPAWFLRGSPLSAELRNVARRAQEEAGALLEADDPLGAKRVVDDAVRSGIHPRHLGDIHRTLAKAVHGPSWLRYHEYTTRHYVVRSDLDERVCHEVAEHLEASLQRFYRDLERPVEKESRRYAVFVFSGEAGYQAYIENLLGERAENTAGVYSPVLKQLLIWNTPDRDDMMRTVRHEGFHQYFDTLGDPPTWLNEGLAEYYENARLASGRWRQDEVHRDHVDVLASAAIRRGRLPDFVRQQRSDFYGRANVNYARSWALVHFLRHSTKENRERFEALIEALEPGRSAEEAMEISGVDFEAIQRDFEQHARQLAGG